MSPRLYCLFSMTSRVLSSVTKVFCHPILYRPRDKDSFRLAHFVLFREFWSACEMLVLVLKFPCRLRESGLPFGGSLRFVTFTLPRPIYAAVYLCFLRSLRALGSLDGVSLLFQEVPYSHAFSTSRPGANYARDSSRFPHTHPSPGRPQHASNETCRARAFGPAVASSRRPAGTST
jgi:hypothetical protein